MHGPTQPTASSVHGTVSVLKNLLPLLGLYAAAPALADRSIGLGWVVMPGVGLLIYRLTMVMHDCGHGTLFVSTRANRWVGRFLGYLTGVDFDCFRRKHWEHHKAFGVPDDPQGFHYLELASMGRTAFLWHVAKPLLGANLRHVFAESVLAPANLVTLVQRGELVAFVLVQLGVAWLLLGASLHWSLVSMPFVGAVTVGLFLSQLRGIAEHGPLESGDRPAGLVRSHASDWLGALLLYDMHFNRHAEHHRHPEVPSRWLPSLREAGQPPIPDLPTMWSTLGRMVASR